MTIDPAFRGLRLLEKLWKALDKVEQYDDMVFEELPYFGENNRQELVNKLRHAAHTIERPEP